MSMVSSIFTLELKQTLFYLILSWNLSNWIGFETKKNLDLEGSFPVYK
jgi:hypothetical protein